MPRRIPGSFLRQSRLLLQIGIIQALIRFDGWLRTTPADLARVSLLTLWMTLLSLALELLNAFIMTALGISLQSDDPQWFSGPLTGSRIVRIAFVLFLLAILEELVFRIAPLGVLAWYRAHTLTLLATAVLSSALFGYMHAGVGSFPVQGLGGLVYSLVFLKCGGITGTERGIFIGAGACICCHFFGNMILATALLAA